MKLCRPFYFLILLGVLSSCQSNRHPHDEVVCETVHRYGVPLEPEDWSARGQYGQVISMRKDGVTVMRTYEAGVLEGDCTYTFPHSETIQKREVFNQGELVKDLSYYPNSLPWQQVVYDSPTHESITTWYESGAPQYREEIENGLLVQGEYYNIDQQLESRVEESNGLKMRRDGTGQIQSIDKIENGRLVLNTTYHPNGIPAVVTPYVNGVVEGERHTYLSGGEPATIEQWTNNMQHGNTIVFEHGEMRSDVTYVNGYRHGIERRYRDEETVAQELNWRQGQKHGPCHSYIGTTCQTDWYFRDQQVPNKATYDMLCNQ